MSFTTRTMFVWTIGIAAILAMSCSTNPTSRLMGWAGFSVYLIGQKQKTLFWLYTIIPPLLGLFAYLSSESFLVDYPAGTWKGFSHFVGEAGLFLTLMTLPFSFFKIDP